MALALLCGLHMVKRLLVWLNTGTYRHENVALETAYRLAFCELRSGV